MGNPPGWLNWSVLLYQFTYAFFVLSIKDSQNILLIGMSIFSGFLFFPPVKNGPVCENTAPGRCDGPAGRFPGGGSLAPSAYVERGLPADRTIIIPRFLTVSGFVVAGWLSGLALREMFVANRLQIARSLAPAGSYAFPLYTLKVTAGKNPHV
jgi:hypothetical protein